MIIHIVFKSKIKIFYFFSSKIFKRFQNGYRINFSISKKIFKNGNNLHTVVKKKSLDYIDFSFYIKYIGSTKYLDVFR